jgi:hypothetical protein
VLAMLLLLFLGWCWCEHSSRHLEAAWEIGNTAHKQLHCSLCCCRVNYRMVIGPLQETAADQWHQLAQTKSL